MLAILSMNYLQWDMARSALSYKSYKILTSISLNFSFFILYIENLNCFIQYKSLYCPNHQNLEQASEINVLRLGFKDQTESTRQVDLRKVQLN